MNLSTASKFKKIKNNKSLNKRQCPIMRLNYTGKTECRWLDSARLLVLFP